MRKDFYKYLTELFKINPKIAILLGDIGVFSMKEAFDYEPKRIYNVGILEQAMIGIAAGFAHGGFIPFVHSIAPFVTERCFEQLKLLAYDQRNVFIVSVGNSYDYTALGVTHHCPDDLRLVGSIPDFFTFCPGNSGDVEDIISSHLHLETPKYVRLSEKGNNVRDFFPKCGDFQILQEGNGGVIVVLGTAILDYSKILAKIDATIVYSYNVSHFNTANLENLFSNSQLKKIITVVEPCYQTDIVTKIALSLHNIESIHSISVGHNFIDKYGSKQEIDDYLGMSDETIVSKLKQIYG